MALYGKIQDYILTYWDPSIFTVSTNINFYNDLVVGSKDIGTGVMIGDRQILTVDHLFENIDPSGYIAIFNWIEKPASSYNNINFEPYNCFRITGYDTFSGQTLKQITFPGKTDKMDLSIIKTDRIMDRSHENIPPLNIYNFTNVKDKLVGKELFMIGHCMGLPQVLTDDAFINPNINFARATAMGIKNLVDRMQPLTQDQFDRLCFANLDGFPGNSGSPIFVKDDKFGWNIVGIYTGGANDYTSNSTGVIKEHFYTEDDYDQSKVFEHFQILEGFPTFKKYCDTDCDYIEISEKSIKNRLIKGEWIKLKMPINPPEIADGVYTVIFNTEVGVKVVYFGGQPTPSTIRGFVREGQNYDIRMINPLTRKMTYNFNKTGTAHGNAIKSGNIFNVTASTDGLLTDTLNFIPNINVGEKPLIVNFNAHIPDPESVISCLWEFGDGNTSSLMYPCHTYTAPGIFTVKLTVHYQGSTDDFTSNDCIEVSDSKDLIQLGGGIKKYCIFGMDSVKINDRARCMDVNGIYMPLACSNGNITIGYQGECGDIFCRGDVWLRGSSTVYGDITTPGDITYQKYTTVTGNTLTDVTIPPSELPQALPEMDKLEYESSEIKDDVYIEPGNECELSPGKYYNYSIKSNSKLKLVSGVYYFNKLEMDINSSMELDEQSGPVRIYITTSLNMSGSIVHSLSGAEGPRNF